jgi:hypothetical protein
LHLILRLIWTTFYQANCGSSGFIDAAVLLSNVNEHEAGTTLGHYQQYNDFQAGPANNLVLLAEEFVRGGLSDLTDLHGFA